jgi:hypothetical protein
MTLALELLVTGLPPKKDGANSMWRKPSEVPRIKALRLAAINALGHRDRPVPKGEVRLMLRLHAPRSAGDLDNFITGVCDGLMGCNQRTPVVLGDWADVPESARPYRALVYIDDGCVTRIEAERLPPGSRGIRYELRLEIV